VPKSLRHSCRSELTRQGISLSLLLEDQRSCCWRAGHFCRPPYVAIGYGLYLHPRRSLEVWRIVSEDCNNLDGLSRFIVSTIDAITFDLALILYVLRDTCRYSTGIMMVTVRKDAAAGAELLKHFENMETINEPDNPTSGCCSFLLIVCTRHIVTIVNEESDGSDPGKQ
jgi:hypothetical protein